MITELDLLHVLKNKQNYYRFKPFLKEHALTEQGLRIIKDIDTYFKVNTGLTDLDWNTFATWFKLVKNSSLKQADQEIYTKIFNNLVSGGTSTSVSSKDILDYFVSLDYAARISDCANQFISGKSSDLSEVQTIMGAYEDELKRASKRQSNFAKTKLNEVIDKTFRKDGLEWKLEELNVSIGPLHKGDFIVIGARPETGKTSFAVDQTCHMAQQLKPDAKVLWINNEEQGERIILRAYQSVLNMDLPDILKDEAKSTAEYLKKMGKEDRIKIADDTNFTIHDIDAICKDIKPDLIIINVLDPEKIGGIQGDNEVARFKKLSVWARNLAKTYGPVFGIVQADGSAEGQKWIYKDQLYGSKTGLQGEADVIITIGALNDPSFNETRFIHVPKNKLPGGPKFDPKKRHGYFEVGFDVEKCQFYSKGSKP